MLKKLELEAQTSGSQSEIRCIDLYDWRPPDRGSDQPLSLGDIALVNDVVGLDVHEPTPRMLDYTKCPRPTGYG
ncbi:MAG: hypothetical protein WA633_15705 [Stellaceae bacterium]